MTASLLDSLCTFDHICAGLFPVYTVPKDEQDKTLHAKEKGTI
jgi:hypothetical protein